MDEQFAVLHIKVRKEFKDKVKKFAVDDTRSLTGWIKKACSDQMILQQSGIKDRVMVEAMRALATKTGGQI